MPNQPVKQTEQWPRVALRRELYDKLKKRSRSINATITDLLELEEKDIERRLAKGKTELLHHISGWANIVAVEGDIVTLQGLPAPNAQGYLEVHVHVEFKGAGKHNMLFTHMGHSLVINCSTFPEHGRTIVIPIHTVTSDKDNPHGH